jgi:hypothetical protein
LDPLILFLVVLAVVMIREVVKRNGVAKHQEYQE